ncbi:MAG TPA: carbohydrate ABC transporter permease [Thermomicrobiales bacterium]|jgi:multiple sugar transport system permease protein
MKSLTIARPTTAQRNIRWRGCVGAAATYIAVIAAVVIMLAPIVWLGITSIRPVTEITSVRLNLLPQEPTLRNYTTVFERYKMATYLKTTTIISLAVVAATLALGAPAAYAMSRFTFFGGKAMYGAIIFFRMIPPVAAIVPLFMVFDQFRLLGSYQGLIIAHTAFKLPVAIWLLRNFFMDLPRELDDSARVDGCSTLGVLWRIALPLIQPGLAATAVLSFLWTWNDLLITLILSTRTDTQMLPLGLTKFVLEYGVDWGSMTAAGVIMFIPTLLFVFVAQRYLIKGLTLGGVKE